MGARTTWTKLNKQFPGHHIPYKEVADFIAACPNYIKTRLGMREALVPVVRDLKPPNSRSAIGIDAVQITPPGKDNHTLIIIIIIIIIILGNYRLWKQPLRATGP